MRLSRKSTAVAGLGLILAVNAVVLVGVAYNRSGEPESVLRFTERELAAPSPWAFQKENSGLSFRLLWRVRDEEDEARGYYFNYSGPGSRASWLNEDKLKELGVELLPTSATESQKRAYEKHGSKQVLLVLELDGPAYSAVLARARERASAPVGDRQGAAQRAEMQAQMLRHEELDSSRLFAIDAGLDAGALRAKYPDRSRYVIVKGRIHPPAYGYGRSIAGRVEALEIDSVNVPLQFRSVFEGATSRSYYAMSQPYTGPRFEATVAFGRRLEPWLTAATRKP